MSSDVTVTSDRCFYCRREMHSACTSGEHPCPCCNGGMDPDFGDDA